MSMDQSLAVAANSLCVIAFLAPKPVPASVIAEQISVNPVVIRRATGKLVSAGIARSVAGVNGGYLLCKPPNEITLQDVYSAISEKGIFSRANTTPQAACIEGAAISAAIATVFHTAEDAFARVLQETTLDELLKNAERA